MGGVADAAAPADEPGIIVTPNPAVANVSDEMRQALQRDLKITAEQAKARLVRADWASRLDRPLRQRLGPAYAGSWLAEDGNEFVVAITDRRLERLVRNSGATPRLVARSEAELSAIDAKLGARAKDPKHIPDRVAGWTVDPQANEVRVQHLPGARAEAEAFAAASGLDVAAVGYETVPARPVASHDVKGGQKYFPTPGGLPAGLNPTYCSTGFAVTVGTFPGLGRAGYLTAGHCAAAGPEVYTGNPTSSVPVHVHQGRFVASFVDQQNDEATVVTDPDFNPRSRVDGHGRSDILVGDGTTQVDGSPVCLSGATSGLQCATIRSGTFDPVFAGSGPGSGQKRNLKASNACEHGGDSGGAVISGTHAQGIHIGGNKCPWFLKYAYFVPIQRALGALGAALRTTPVPTTPPAPGMPSPKWTVAKQFWGGLGGAVQGKVASVSLSPNSVQIFGRGTDNGLYTNKQVDGVWSGWQGLGEVVTEPPTAVARNGGIDVYFRGGDTRPYFKRFNGTSWQPAVKLGDVDVQGSIEAVSSGPNTVHLFIRASDNELKLNFSNGTQWSGWFGLGGELNASPPSALVYTGASGQEVVDVFVRWSDDSIRYRRSDPNTQQGFQPWVNLGGAWSQPPVAVNVGPQHNMVFAVHRGDKTLHVQRWRNNDWMRTNGDIKLGWRGLGGNVQSIPTAVAGPANQVRVFARDNNQRVNMASWLGNEFFWENWVALDGDTVAPIGASRRAMASGAGFADAFGVDAATLQPFHTTVDIAAPPVTVTLNKTAFEVGDGATYTVTGPPGAPIWWSSTKNGVTTGEDYSFYGHYLDATGTFTAYAGEWGGSTVGTWVKYVHVGTQSLQTAQVTFTVSHRPVAVYTDQSSYQIGVGTITYAVTGPANQPIYWSSWHNDSPTGENNSFYGHYTNANGVFTATVGPWTPGTEGRWIKQINIGGVLRFVEFDVFP